MTIKRALLFLLLLILSGTPVWAQETGTVRGTVLDGVSAELVRNALVEVIGTDFAVSTNLDGQFSLDLPPGTYEIEVSHDGFFPNRIEALNVASGADITLDVVLPPTRTEVQSITVTADAVTLETSTQEIMLLERRASTTVSDLIGSEEISANGDSDAAGVMSRVVGVSLMDDKYVFVRGLGDRYSTTQLNGSLMPSTEADRKVVPLDLFPANLVDNIKLEKTFTPNQPGEFSGALVKIETVEFPAGPTLKFSASQGFNTQSTFKDFLTYPGGKHDWLGFGDSRRALPSAIPADRVARGSIFSDRGYTPAEIEGFGESFENIWNPRTEGGKPNQGFNFLAGNTFGRLGVVYALTYSNKFQTGDSIQNYYVVGLNNKPRQINKYNIQSGTNTVRLGNTLNFAIRANNNHKFLFKNFFSKDASDEARVFEGYNGDFATNIRNQRIHFVEETIYAGQLAGEHFFSGLNGLLEWRVAFNRAGRDEPDLREALYIQNQATGNYRLREQTQSGFRQWIEATDKIWEPGLDFVKFVTLGSVSGSIKAGGSYSSRDRRFNSRRFRFTHRSTRGLDLSQDPEALFLPEYIGPNFELREDTRPTDHYLGDQIIRAGYAMVDFFLSPRWRVIGGARVEKSVQKLDSFDLFAINPTKIQTKLDDTDILPSINVVYAISPEMNLRGAFSQTLSRPNFRELAPFDFTDVTGGNTVVGNPDLVRTKLNNVDFRWEWFQGASDLLAVSVFYKNFDNPIEQIFQPTSQLRISFENVDGARNLGMETELRKSLGDFSSGLQNFSVSANYTFVSSQVEIGERQLSVVTSTNRALAGQSQNVFNGTFEYANPRFGNSIRLLYNMVGRRITDVGALGLPDIYQEPQHVFDIVYKHRLGGEEGPMELSFSADNLLNDEKKFTQGGELYRLYRNGRSYSAGLSIRFY